MIRAWTKVFMLQPERETNRISRKFPVSSDLFHCSLKINKKIIVIASCFHSHFWAPTQPPIWGIPSHPSLSSHAASLLCFGHLVVSMSTSETSYLISKNLFYITSLVFLSFFKSWLIMTYVPVSSPPWDYKMITSYHACFFILVSPFPYHSTMWYC